LAFSEDGKPRSPVVQVQGLPGCISQGASLEEAVEDVREAIECYEVGEES